MTDDGAKQNSVSPSPSYCCISHEFAKAASKSPNKIAVIHVCSGPKFAPQFHGQLTPVSGTTNADKLFDEFTQTESASTSTQPPVYEGDECFTFSQIQAAVDSLSHRLRHILDGGDDPCLIKPSPGTLPGKQSMNSPILKSSNCSDAVVEQSFEFQDMRIPRILGIYMVPSVEYIIAVLSVMRCGEAFMPLDPSWPKERILSVLASSNADLIVGCSSSFDGQRDHQLDKSHWLVDSSSCSALFISMKEELRECNDYLYLPWPCQNKRLRVFCYLMYTSGSTGKPKGICGTELGLLNRFSWMQELYPTSGEEILLFKTSISFVDHLQEFLGSLLATCTLVVPPFKEMKDNLLSITEYLQAYSVSRLVVVPSLMRIIVPTLRSPSYTRVKSSLKFLVLSGEVFYISLWHVLSKLLPNTIILNLYGSTEVSGDCMYFDCKGLPSILENESLISVPIGIPIRNCDVVLVGDDVANNREIYVGGSCLAAGYFNYPGIKALDVVKLPHGSCHQRSMVDTRSLHYFRTGDFAKEVQSGDLVFLGRKDRSIKVNGQRVALEEIEYTLREHPDVADAAVISHNHQGEVALLDAYVVAKQMDECVESFRSSFRCWLAERLPLVMIPNNFFFMKAFPMSSTGKVDYTMLSSSRGALVHLRNEIKEVPESGVLQAIKKAFSNALMIEKVSIDDDFFAMGGDSISAAHASHKLGINMRLLYAFPSPYKLMMALLEQGSHKHDLKTNADSGLNTEASESWLLSSLEAPNSLRNKPRVRLFDSLDNSDAGVHPAKFLKRHNINPMGVATGDAYPWISFPKHTACSFSRCNRMMLGNDYEANRLCEATFSNKSPREKNFSVQELWKVDLESCVDASPLVVVREGDIYIYIGSHSHKFLCIEATSGSVKWKTQLEGRVECTAAILDDFSEVVVGCYQGNIYFLSSLNGSISWTFRTGGEVKSQPVVDKRLHLVWCGSYDHNLYALDYQNHCCIFKLPAGGSIYGSPVIDEVREKLYVAATSGRLTSLCTTAIPFCSLWVQDLGAPIFGSLSVDHLRGNVICCLVNGHVVALDASGSIIWRGITGGPIFAGPCISQVLHSQLYFCDVACTYSQERHNMITYKQYSSHSNSFGHRRSLRRKPHKAKKVLICSRDGSIYSFELESGNLLWKHIIGDPISSSAYVDENLIVCGLSHVSSRFICVCGSSGCIYLLRISLEEEDQSKTEVEEFSRFNLQGDIFSSPVMIGGRIFVGCRDNYLHCIGVQG